jgi:hypothetical protein
VAFLCKEEFDQYALAKTSVVALFL